MSAEPGPEAAGSPPAAEASPDAPEKAWADGVDPERRRRLAQYFTPFPLARFMARWVLDGPRAGDILDPALGLGVFARAVAAESGGVHRFKGWEIDPVLAERAEGLLLSLPGRIAATVVRGDFLDAPWEARHGGILANPPYLRFQEWPGREARLAELEARMGVRLGGLTNLHCLFLLKCLHLLEEDGRAAFVMPWEFLNAGYGRRIKEYLLGAGALRHAVVFDSDKGVFDGAVTTACVLLLAKDGKGGRGGGEVAFHRTAGVGELSALYRASVAPGRISRAGASRAGDPSEAPAPTVLKAEDMDPGAKWRGYWKKTSLAGYRHMAPLGERFLVLRGIATGSNAFFVLGEAERLEAGLPEDCLLPCVAKARDAAGPLFTLRDHAALREGGRPAFLLDAEGRDHPAVKAYLEAGVRAGVDRRFLTRNRRCWYALENRPPAPLWFPVFARGIRRPVLNRAGVRNLTAFHCVYPRPGAEDLIDPLFLWLLTGTGGALARDNAREYGAGLEKVEPKDLAETPGPDFARMGEEDLAALRGLVRRFEEEGPAAEADIARAASAIFAARLE